MERRFECVFCAKTFTQNQDLEGHLHGHIGENHTSVHCVQPCFLGKEA